jgi:hypothetical protein
VKTLLALLAVSTEAFAQALQAATPAAEGFPTWGLIVIACVVVAGVFLFLEHRAPGTVAKIVGGAEKGAGSMLDLLHKQADTNAAVVQTNASLAAVVASPPVQAVVNAAPATVALPAPTPAPTLAPAPLLPTQGVTVRDPHYLYPGDPGYPTGGYAASQGLPIINPGNPPGFDTPNPPPATYTTAQVRFATLFAATGGMGITPEQWRVQDAAAINALMSGYLPHLQEARMRKEAGATTEELRAWLETTN